MGDDSQCFGASYDTTTKIISAVVWIVILVAVFTVTQNAAVAGVGVLLILVSYAYSPRQYTVSERSVFVKRLIGSVRIPLDGTREIRRTTVDDLKGCMRLWGNGGLFGYYGLFSTSKLGNCNWYVTNRRNTLVLITDRSTAVFSPDNADGFVAAIQATVPVPQSVPGGAVAGSARSSEFGRVIGVIAGCAVGIAAMVFAVWSVRYSPGPPSYTLTPDSLTIHDRFYPVTLNRDTVDIEHIRIVDFSVDTDWRPTARTNGFANSHYRSGWFRVAGGQKIRMYRADGRRVVLLPPKGDGTAVLLETRAPEKFVEEVRGKWAH